MQSPTSNAYRMSTVVIGMVCIDCTIGNETHVRVRRLADTCFTIDPDMTDQNEPGPLER